MVSSISSAPQAQQVVPAATAKPQAAKPDASHTSVSSPPSTTVNISAAAQAAAELAETPAQTAREAQSGDRQAQRLAAKQAQQAQAMKAGAPPTHS